MKTRYKLLLAVLLIWAQVFAFSLTGGGSALFAQDAFYIYRNDGDFNGFFFDEIKRMGVSKFDLDSIEHDVYVVQEIELADTTYRIPLAAIDSVGFQQPEIRFNPRFKNLDQMGLTQYLTIQSNSYLIFTIPRSVVYAMGGQYSIIQTGDVLASTSVDFYGKEGFCYKVRSVSSEYIYNSSCFKYYVRLEKVDSFGDVFDQFITTERVYSDEQGNIRRRIAGCNEDGTVRRGPAREKGSEEMSLISISTNIQREYEPKEGVNIDLGAEIGLQLGLRVTYNCSWRRIYVKFEAPADFKLTPKVGVKTSKSFEWIVDGLPKFLKAIKFPIQCPIFQTLPVPELVLRGGGEIAATINFPSVGFGVQQNFVIDTDAATPAQYYWSKSTTGSEADPDAIDLGSAEMSLSGNVQLALKLSANIETCDWFSDLLFCRIGLDMFVGPKVEGNVKLSTDMFDKYDSSKLYSIFTGTNFKITPISIDIEANGVLGYLFKDKEKRNFLSFNVPLFPTTFYAIPTVTDFTAEGTNGSPYGQIVVKTKTNNRPFMPTSIGTKFVYCSPFSGEAMPETYSKPIYDPHYHTFVDNERECTFTFNDLRPGRYAFIPVLSFLGMECENQSFYRNLFVWPTKFNHARVVVEGLMHRDSHRWGNNNGTTFDEHPITDETGYYSCDMDVQCEGDEDNFTLTCNYNHGSVNSSNGREIITLTLHAKIEDGMMYILDGNYNYNYDREWTSNTSSTSGNGYSHWHKEFSFSNKMIPFGEGRNGILRFRANDRNDVTGSSYVKNYTKYIIYNSYDGSVDRSYEEHDETNAFFKEGEKIEITVELGF